MTATIQTTDDRIEIFMRRPETIEKFVPVLGKYANAFISSALILINSDPKLQSCTTMSLYKSILRAASLELSLDPSLRQGWIIPRGKKIKTYKTLEGVVVPEHYVQEGNFQPHYNGLRALAERTGKYRIINVSPVYEGQTVWLDQLTGLHNVQLKNGLMTIPEQVTRLVTGRIDVTGGAPEKKVVGYLGYYKTTKGLERTVYMSKGEIHDHAKKWAGDAYTSKYGAWQDPNKLPTMEMKTVFIQLTKTMDLSGKENDRLRKAVEIVEGDDFEDIDADDFSLIQAPQPEPEDEKENSPVPVRKEQPDIDMVFSNSVWAIETAATYWKIDKKQASEKLASKINPTATMTKTEIMQVIREDEEKNQQTIVDQINPLDTAAIEWSAKQWNITVPQAKKSINDLILKGKIKNPMEKVEFKKIVTGQD
jgi:recombination protein RecT